MTGFVGNDPHSWVGRPLSVIAGAIRLRPYNALAFSAPISDSWERRQSSLGTAHHAWIGGFFIVGSGAHATLLPTAYLAVGG
jgi:hypothetical protein